jgi:biopolymer transport protein ExbD
MAQKRRFIDVWLVEPNTVYREVPFAVVTDWIQQARLLPDDMIRPSGTAQWFKVGESPDFKPYVPQAEPYQIEDQTEALEEVQLDFTWKKRPDDEDDDVDMIPLIDVSLVLLIFFMLTSTAAVGVAAINTPSAINGNVVGKNAMVWVNIDLPQDGTGSVIRGGNPIYSVSFGDAPAAPADSNLHTITAAMERLKLKLDEFPGPPEVTIRAHKDVRAGDVRDVTIELTRLGDKVKQKFIAVSEKGQ